MTCVFSIWVDDCFPFWVLSVVNSKEWKQVTMDILGSALTCPTVMSWTINRKISTPKHLQRTQEPDEETIGQDKPTERSGTYQTYSGKSSIWQGYCTTCFIHSVVRSRMGETDQAFVSGKIKRVISASTKWIDRRSSTSPHCCSTKEQVNCPTSWCKLISGSILSQSKMQCVLQNLYLIS